MTTSPEGSSSRGWVVVTGASTGIGAASAHALANRGFHVLAGVRRDQDADSLRRPGVEPIILDITRPDHIAELAARVGAQPGALRALVNNAGIAVNAPVEAMPLDEWRRTFEVNLFGHVAVTQALLPALLRHSGRVVNISSVGGKVAMATYGPYAATKFALEAVSDALRREVDPLGVKVIVVEPGGVRTEMADRVIAVTSRLAAEMSPDLQHRYGPLVQAIMSQSAAGTSSGVSADAVATVIANAVSIAKPRTRYTVGRQAAVIAGLSRILPDRVLDRIFAAGLRPHYPKTTTAGNERSLSLSGDSS